MWGALDGILFAAATMNNTGGQSAEAQAAAARVTPATLVLEEAFRQVMPYTSGRIIDLLASHVGMVRGTMESDRSWPHKGEMLFTVTPMIMDVLGGPGQGPLYRVRWRYRARRAREARAFLDGCTIRAADIPDEVHPHDMPELAIMPTMTPGQVNTCSCAA